MRRFFITPSAVSGDTIVISGAEAHHLHTVLRLKPEETITLFDGTGLTYRAKIKDLSKEVVHCTILSASKVQKTTELGISTIQPFTSKRCTVNKKSEKQISRWQRITLEACKQSGQSIVPEVLPPIALSKLLEETKQYESKLIFYEEVAQTTELNDLFNVVEKGTMPKSVFFLIGPEGGFTDIEITEARGAGFIPVSLGKLILRAETASIAATAILQFILGNLRHKTVGDTKG